jgi:hypothetical protein
VIESLKKTQQSLAAKDCLDSLDKDEELLLTEVHR